MWNGVLSYHFWFDIVKAVNIYILCYSAMDNDLWEESDTSLFSVPRVWYLHLQCTKGLIPPSAVYQGSDSSICSVPSVWYLHLQCSKSLIPPASVYHESDSSLCSVPRIWYLSLQCSSWRIRQAVSSAFWQPGTGDLVERFGRNLILLFSD